MGAGPGTRLDAGVGVCVAVVAVSDRGGTRGRGAFPRRDGRSRLLRPSPVIRAIVLHLSGVPFFGGSGRYGVAVVGISQSGARVERNGEQRGAKHENVDPNHKHRTH